MAVSAFCGRPTNLEYAIVAPHFACAQGAFQHVAASPAVLMLPAGPTAHDLSMLRLPWHKGLQQLGFKEVLLLLTFRVPLRSSNLCIGRPAYRQAPCVADNIVYPYFIYV